MRAAVLDSVEIQGHAVVGGLEFPVDAATDATLGVPVDIEGQVLPVGRLPAREGEEIPGRLDDATLVFTPATADTAEWKVDDGA